MAKILRWVFGIFFIIGGIGNMTTSVPGGILAALAGLLMLPPTFALIARLSGQSFGKPIKYGAVLVPFVIGMVLIGKSEDSQVAKQKKLEAAKEAEEAKQARLAFEKLPQAVKDSMARAQARAKVREDSIVKEQDARTAAYEAKKDRKAKVDAQFSAWDGSHRGVTAYIKEHMNDPDSYEHVSTRFVDKGDFITVMTQFRGKNAFGGKVLNTAVAKVDFEGNVLSLEML